MNIRFLLFASILFFITSCGKDQVELDREEIEEYIAANNLDAESTETGLYYVIEAPGSEDKPSLRNEVTVHYEGFLTNGNVFDSSFARGEPATFSLANVIRGWQEGIPLFGRGGKGLLLIPSRLGYGTRSQQGIPANSVLIFRVEVIDF